MGIFTFMSKVSPAFIGLCFLLHCLPMRVMAQADSIQSAMSRSLQTFGFGPELIITSPPAFYIDHNTQPDLHRAQQAGFDLPYDSLEEQLARQPHSKIFWIRAGLRNASDSILPIEIYCGTLDYTDCWWISPGHPAQLVSAGSLRSPLSGSSLVQRQYNILPLTLLPRQSGAPHNLQLSQQRADAVRAQLVVMGIDASRLSTRGLGDTKPISDNGTQEGKANNRRVEFIKM